MIAICRDRLINGFLMVAMLPIVLPVEIIYRVSSWVMEKLVGDN